jgi:hypothetical protein
VSDPFVTSATIETRGAHDHVRVFIRHQMSGELVVSRGDGPLVQARLMLGDWPETAVDPTERPTPVPPPSLVEMLRKGRIDIEDVPWLCKDFAVLYQAARQLIEREPDARGNTPDSDYEFLEAQLRRLRPAFDQCESVRQRCRQGGGR